MHGLNPYTFFSRASAATQPFETPCSSILGMCLALEEAISNNPRKSSFSNNEAMPWGVAGSEPSMIRCLWGRRAAPAGALLEFFGFCKTTSDVCAPVHGMESATLPCSYLACSSLEKCLKIGNVRLDDGLGHACILKLGLSKMQKAVLLRERQDFFSKCSLGWITTVAGF